MAVAGLVAAWAGWRALMPARRLDLQRFQRLAANRNFEAAERLLREQLERAPDDPQAHLRSAELILARLDQGEPTDESRAQAALALRHLERVRVQDPRLAALASLYRGRALFVLDRWREEEAAHREALRLDPTIPEAAWGLLDLFYLQGRTEEAIRLVLRQYEHEPDPHDRAQLVLELLRQDTRPPDSASLVQRFEPVVRKDPDDTPSASALGLALIHNSRVDDGLRVLKDSVERHPGDPVAWDGLLSGLEEAKEPEALAKAFDQLPAALAGDPRFAKHRGQVAEDRRDWGRAVEAYRRALEFEPHSTRQVYLLAQALRFAGRRDEAGHYEAIDAAYRRAFPEARDLYDEANAARGLGLLPHAELYRRLGDLRERMNRPEEARLWYEMALRDDPKDATSRAALDRLGRRRGS